MIDCSLRGQNSHLMEASIHTLTLTLICPVARFVHVGTTFVQESAYSIRMWRTSRLRESFGRHILRYDGDLCRGKQNVFHACKQVCGVRSRPNFSDSYSDSNSDSNSDSDSDPDPQQSLFSHVEGLCFITVISSLQCL